MFRRAVFAFSRREVVMAPSTEEQFAHTAAWMILGYAHAIVEDFREYDAQTRKTYEPALHDVIHGIYSGLFMGTLDADIPDFLSRYEKEDLMLDLAMKVESGAMPLRSHQNKMNSAPRICIYISRQHLGPLCGKLPSKGFQRPLAVLSDLADCVSLFKSSTFEVDACSSLSKRMAPVLPKLRAIGSPCATAAADTFDFLSTWDMGKDLALVMTP